jgi:hypothetical protein
MLVMLPGRAWIVSTIGNSGSYFGLKFRLPSKPRAAAGGQVGSDALRNLPR